MEELVWNIKTKIVEIGWSKSLIWKFDWDSDEAMLHIGKLRVWFLFMRHKLV